MPDKLQKVSAGNTAASVRVIGAGDTAELEQVRQFFRNYAAWLGVDLSYQNFDEEMATLPGRYAEPQGRLFYAEHEGRGAGCVGIRPLAEGVCELKRLYVDPACRGLGVGRLLALEAIRAARRIGYRKMLIDTLPAMRIAVRLYRELGFQEAPAYYQTAVEGTQFLALDLENWSEDGINNRNLTTCSTSTVPGRTRCARSTRAISNSFPTCRRRSTAVDRLLRLARAGQPNRRPAAGRGLRPSQRRQRGRAYRPQLPVGDPVRRRRAQGQAHHGGRPLRLRRRARRRSTARASASSTSGCATSRTCAPSTCREIDSLPEEGRHDRLCELNVLEQVVNVCHTFVVQDAWQRGQPLTIHGWIYGLKDGLMRDLGITVNAADQLPGRYDTALSTLI